MNSILTVLQIVAPVFLLASVGFVWVRMGFEYPLQFVTRLGTTLAVPCLVFVALMETRISTSDLSWFVLAIVVVNLVLTLCFHVYVRLTGLPQRSYLAPLIFGNTGNIGLPLCLFAFGEAGLAYGVVVFSVTVLYSFSYGIYLFAGKGSLRRVVQEPTVLATLLGTLFLWRGWHTPQFLTNALDLLGQMAIPLMLITLGVAVARMSPDKLGRAFWLSLVKAALCIVTAWGVGAWFGLSHTAFGVLVVQTATPVAVTSYLLAERFKADSASVAGLVVASTLLSVAIMPLILAAVL